jgi:hypothetical protein
MTAIDFIVVFSAGAAASSFGTLVGGGGLITVPTLLFLGLPPQNAIATNRLGMMGLLFAGWYKFHKKGYVDYRIGMLIGIPTLLGAILGANLILQISEPILKRTVAMLTIVVLVIVMTKPQLGIERSIRTIRRPQSIVDAVISFFIGIYGGFYGPACGTFYSYILLLLFGQSYLEAAGTWKIPGLLFSVAAVTIFATSELILYSQATVLFFGSFVGSYVGAHYADLIGNVWIKRLFFLIVLIMSIRLII